MKNLGQRVPKEWGGGLVAVVVLGIVDGPRRILLTSI